MLVRDKYFILNLRVPTGLRVSSPCESHMTSIMYLRILSQTFRHLLQQYRIWRAGIQRVYSVLAWGKSNILRWFAPLVEGNLWHSRLCCRVRWHDDVIKWKHFPRYWPFVRGIHRSPVNSPHKGQWRGALMFTLICARINGWVNNHEAGDLRRYRTHYDVIVMGMTFTGDVRMDIMNIDRQTICITI